MGRGEEWCKAGAALPRDPSGGTWRHLRHSTEAGAVTLAVNVTQLFAYLSGAKRLLKVG